MQSKLALKCHLLTFVMEHNGHILQLISSAAKDNSNTNVVIHRNRASSFVVLLLVFPLLDMMT